MTRRNCLVTVHVVSSNKTNFAIWSSTLKESDTKNEERREEGRKKNAKEKELIGGI